MAYGPPRPSPHLFVTAKPVPLTLRALATVADLVIMVVVFLALLVVMGGAFGSGGYLVVGIGLGIASWLYKPVAEAWKGQTVGKWMLQLKVVDAASKRPIGFGQAVTRNLVLFVATAPICAVATLLTEPRRALHDLLAGTDVVREG